MAQAKTILKMEHSITHPMVSCGVVPVYLVLQLLNDNEYPDFFGKSSVFTVTRRMANLHIRVGDFAPTNGTKPSRPPNGQAARQVRGACPRIAIGAVIDPVPMPLS
jgi:hypothetical protein